MAKTLFPIIQWVDTNGDPLVSGTINTYVEGTTTNKATYSDRAGTANANPIVLDSAGSSQIWMDADARYKLVVKNSSGTTIFTLDNLSPIAEGLTSTTLAADLDVNGNSIISAANGDIPITPNGTGDVILDGLKWPQADGTAGQSVITDGAGQLSFVSSGTGSMDDVIDDTTPQLGGSLDTNAFNITFDSTKGILDDSSNEQLLFTKTSSAVNYLNITNGATSNDPIISAGGGDTNIGISLQPKAGGKVTLDNHAWPNADGTSGQAIVTDGAGVLSFETTASGKVLQVQVDQTQSDVSTTSAIPEDDTAPQSTEGSELLTDVITAADSNNLIIIDVTIGVTTVSQDDGVFVGSIYKTGGSSALATATVSYDDGTTMGSFTLRHVAIAGSTSPITYSFRYGPLNSGTAYVHTDRGTARFGNTSFATMTLTEVSV